MVALMTIEQEVARRLGPYLREKATAGAVNQATVPTLQSTVERESVENLWVLRRGLLLDGTAVPGFDSGDRVRLVSLHTLATGIVVPDRNWAGAVVANEMLEFHHLHPDNELRPAVLNGLKRCYFLDMLTVTPVAAAYERNITTSAAWLTDASQIYNVSSFVASDTIRPPRNVSWWQVSNKAAGVFLSVLPDPYPSSLLLEVRRPHFSYVNSLTSVAGPTLDADVLSVDLFYAAAAGHIEAWRHNRARLIDVAQSGRAIRQSDAAEEFTKQAQIHFTPPKSSRPQFTRPSSYQTQDEVVV